MKLYIVAWTGGAEIPSYQASRTESEAFDIAARWMLDVEEGFETVDVLELDTDTLRMARLTDEGPTL